MRWKRTRAPVALACAAALLAGGAAAQSTRGAEARKHPPLDAADPMRCASCHRTLFERKTFAHPIAAEDCSLCHPVTITMDKPGGRIAPIDRRPALCLRCHTGLRDAADWTLAAPHAPVGDTCVVCHAPHASTYAHLLTAPAPALCLGCHEATSLPATHRPHLTARTSCTTCHAAHGSSSLHMLADERSRAASRVPALTGPAPAPQPTPTEPPGPTATPTSAPAPVLAPDGWMRARALLREGRLADAAGAFRSHLESRRNGFTIQFFVACSPDTVQRAVARVPGEQLYILPVRYQNRDCYSIAWGTFDREELARAAALDLPRYLKGIGVKPKVASVSTVLR